jgi:predicted lipoprotein with Yx(FWY)xxD motif
LKKAILVAVVSLALVAAGVATAAAVTHQSTRSGTLTLHKTKFGKVLANKSGMTLYLFVADRKGRSACYGQCATYWPPLIVKGKPTAGTGIKANLLGVTMRKNGQHQVMYRGHPLYRFKLDKKPGQIAGQGQAFFGGKWWGVSAAGTAVKRTTTVPSTTTGGTTTAPTTTYCPYSC